MEKHIKSVLYGPRIEFQSDDWIKCSLLLWDSIYRIVPNDFRPNDSPIVMEAEQAGLIKNITLEPEDLSTVCDEFQAFVKGAPFLPAGMEDEGDVELIHPEKVDARLYPLLREMAVRFDPNGWLPFPERIAHAYMMFLARTVSRRRNLATATDSPEEWAIMPYFKENGNFDERLYNPDAGAFYSFMIFSDVLPTDLRNVEPKKLIQFALKRSEEKTRLRTTLQDFGEDIATCSSKSHVQDMIATYEKQITLAKDEYVKSMDFYTPEQGYAVLTVGLPLSLAWYALVGANNPYDVFNLSTSVLVGAVAAYAEYRRVQEKNREKCATSYLFEIDRALGGDSSAGASHRVFEEFMND